MRTPFGYSDSGHVDTQTHAHINNLLYAQTQGLVGLQNNAEYVAANINFSRCPVTLVVTTTGAIIHTGDQILAGVILVYFGSYTHMYTANVKTHVCICVCVHIYVYTYIYIGIYLYILTYCTYTYIYICISIHTCMYIYMHMYIRIYICIRIHTYVYVCVYIHVKAYVYIHIYIHIYISTRLCT